MAKLERNKLMFFASFDGENWEALGRDNDDLKKELNPDTETFRNVLGETNFKHNGYKPEVSIDPYYADDESVLYDDLVSVAMSEAYDDAATKGYFVEVMFASATGGKLTGEGKKREAYIVPQSVGGDTSAVGIPFTVTPIGTQADCTVSYDIATRAVTIAPKA